MKLSVFIYLFIFITIFNQRLCDCFKYFSMHNLKYVSISFFATRHINLILNIYLYLVQIKFQHQLKICNLFNLVFINLSIYIKLIKFLNWFSDNDLSAQPPIQ